MCAREADHDDTTTKWRCPNPSRTLSLVSVDPNTPVIIGAAQVSLDTPDMTARTDPISLMIEAAKAAVVDTGGSGVAADIGMVAVVAGLFSHSDPGSLVAREIGADEGATILTTWGGNTPIALAGELCDRIRRGEIEAAVMVGGESTATRKAVAREGGSIPHWDEITDEPPEQWGSPLEMGGPVDSARGGALPVNNYAILDSAIRARRGESLDEARDRAARLWAGFARVAVENPHAADRSGMSAAQIRDPNPSNRMVGWPYTKAMCANNHVDHAGAVIITSQQAADRLRVPIDRRVYPHETLIATDTDSFLPRAEISRVPALAAAGAQFASTWGSMDEIAHLDLYGCFPSIVSHTCELFGIDPDRQLTVTGGLGFMGGPLNFAAGQSLIAMVHALRADPGSYGMVQGNGGQASKHAFGVYSSTPPLTARSREPIVSGPTATPANPDAEGPVVLDGVTVEYDRDGPTRAVAICRLGSGSRLWASSSEHAVMHAFIPRECVGQAGEVRNGELRL